MSKRVKIKLSILVAIAGGLIAVEVIGPERLKASAFPRTVVLLAFVGAGLGLKLIWGRPKGGSRELAIQNHSIAAETQHSKRTPGKIVGGVLLIRFALVGGVANLGRNPTSRLSTLLMMAVLIFLGLSFIGVLGQLRSKKQ
jgi:hypothetical protein